MRPPGGPAAFFATARDLRYRKGRSPPFRVDVSEAIQPGRNELRVGVANLLKNRLESSDNYRRPSGLLGPVQLIPFYVEDLGD